MVFREPPVLSILGAATGLGISAAGGLLSALEQEAQEAWGQEAPEGVAANIYKAGWLTPPGPFSYIPFYEH